MTTTYKLTNRFFFCHYKIFNHSRNKIKRNEEKIFFQFSHTNPICTYVTNIQETQNENKHTQTRFAPQSQEE
jgi:hypothetical protein